MRRYRSGVGWSLLGARGDVCSLSTVLFYLKRFSSVPLGACLITLALRLTLAALAFE